MSAYELSFLAGRISEDDATSSKIDSTPAVYLSGMLSVKVASKVVTCSSTAGFTIVIFSKIEHFIEISGYQALELV